jgi:superfamily II DNA/RNA helicase
MATTLTATDITALDDLPTAPDDTPGQFSDFPLRPEVLRAIAEMGYTEPTKIQAAVLPPLLAGRDVVGQAQTGSGKTAAFGIPIANVLSHDEAVGALVLVPTRELCRQVTDELTKLICRCFRSMAAPACAASSPRWSVVWISWSARQGVCWTISAGARSAWTKYRS